MLNSVCRIDMTKIKTQQKTNDKIIREFLIEELDFKYGQDSSVRVIEELGLNHGSARVDIAVLNGIMHGYEIKSDMDTLYRLPAQIKAYNAVFKRMTIVVGAKHLEHVINMVPEWWEIRLIKETGDKLHIFQIRSGQVNKQQDKQAIARLLWKDEAIDILRIHSAEKGILSQPRNKVYERLALTLDVNTLQSYVKDTLFNRTNWRTDQA